MSTRTPYVGGNWKMNTDRTSSAALASDVEAGARRHAACEVVVFPPFPYLVGVGRAIEEVSEHGTPAVKLGAQDCSERPDGAFTGEVSLGQLRDCGVSVVLTGHSERRHVIGETDGLVNAKTRAVLDAGLECVLCIGELLEEREAGQTDAVNERQLRAALEGVSREQAGQLTIAYEPVWAIGTGKVATPDDAQDAHARCREVLASVFDTEVAGATRIMYGGSLKPSNASDLMSRPDIDGGLVGGASLKASDFLQIVEAAARVL